MDRASIQTAKIVATPTPHAWSQAYSAGNLFIVLSLEYTQVISDGIPLAAIGKDLLSTFESEYFTLEQKNLATIKQALITTCEKIPGGVNASFLVAVVRETPKPLLYALMYGDGKILLQRQKKRVTILSATNNTAMLTASGFLQDDDLIMLESPAFSKSIPQDLVTHALHDKNPMDIAETLSPYVHEQEDNGSAAALFFSVTIKTIPTETLEDDDTIETLPQEHSPSLLHRLQTFAKRLPLPVLKVRGIHRLSRLHLMFLAIALILAVVLMSSIATTMQQQAATKNQAQYQNIMQEAQKKYDEGQNLLSLNRNLARDDFMQAKKIAEEGRPKLIEGSKEQKDLDVFLQQVNNALGGNVTGTVAQASEVAMSTSLLLTTIAKTNGTLAATQDDKAIYLLTQDAILKANKPAGTTTTLIRNNNQWQAAVGIGKYSENLYLLDKKANQIFKFVPNGTAYSKSNYLTAGITPNFSKAVGMSIDGSVYTLYQDGNIIKYTRGSPDTFTLAGFDNPLTNPTKIYTDAESNVYVLEPSKQRIVMMNKSGTFQSQVQSEKLKNAKDFEVREKDKLLYFLSDGKLWQLPLP